VAPAITLDKPISLRGRLRIAVRMTLIILLLAILAPLHMLVRPLPGRSPMPRLFLGAVATIAGVRVTERGHRVRRGAFFISNHVSWMDIPALAGSTGAAFVGHDGLASMPVLRWLCSLNETVFIARHDRFSVARQAQQLREALDENGALAIFPEGTTSDGTDLLPFKSALLSAIEPVPPGIEVQPVLLDYEEAPGVAWVGDDPGLDNFLRILARKRPVRLAVHFLEPLSGEEVTDRKTMAAAAREAIARAMKPPATLS
jgi:1-acyl-sn-glycerol-3-phosphate acyltransferase